ncbi:MAG: type II secretion system secretin GspD, partial [Desulfamplus sp.]|nr:type II secretion system secretin GspD [Desulfamplus sp.]
MTNLIKNSIKNSFFIKRIIKKNIKKNGLTDKFMKPHQLIKIDGGVITISLVCLLAVIILFGSGCASQRRYSEQPDLNIGQNLKTPKQTIKTTEQTITIAEQNIKTSEDKNLAIFDSEASESKTTSSHEITSSQDKKHAVDLQDKKHAVETLKTTITQGETSTLSSITKTPSISGSGKNRNKIKFPAPEASSTPVKVELAFDNADLFEVLDATLFELFKVNYIIDPQVRAKVSFHFSGNYTKYQFIELLNEILQLSNLAITQGPGDMFKVVRKNESAGLTAQDIYEDGLPDASGDISRLIRLKYLDAASVLKSIQTFTSKGAPISIDTVNNSIIVTDTLENVDKVVNVLALMDVPYFMDISWRIFPVREVEAKDIVQNITKLIKSAGLYYRPGALKGGYEVLSIDSINAVLVATRWPEILDIVDKWISAMDYLGDDAGNGTGVFVYFVENGTAVELADILKQLYGAQSSGSSSQKTQIVKPTATVDKSKKQDPSLANSKTGNVSGDLSGDVEIIPDETNNAIIFKASQRDYKIIKNVLKELDVTPRQVLINVIIAEVTLNDKTQYGVQWLMNNKMGNYKGQGGFDISKSTRAINQVLGTASNISYGIYNSSDVLKGLVTALGSDSKVNILSSPNIMAVDNKEALIEVGEDVPTVTGTVTDINGGITNSVQYKKTGIILKVTPHVNSSGLVKMELSQEVSEKGNYDEELNNYSILTRKAETSLVVSDQQTILLGGLMRSNITKSDAGVPVLKDIPVLGYLFKSKTDESTKTELIFLLTPHV